MNIRRREFLTAMLATFSAAPLFASDTRRPLRKFFDQAFREEIQNDPTRATLLHFPTPGGHSHNTWTLRTDKWFVDRANMAKQNIENLEQICAGAECESDDVSLFRLSQKAIVSDSRWRRHRVPFFGGLAPHIQAPSILIEHHKIDSAIDAEAYVERAERIPGLLEVEIQRFAVSVESGCAPPSFNFSDLSASAERSAAGMEKSSNHPLLATLKSKCNAARLQPAVRDRLVNDLQNILNDRLAPAVRKFGVEMAEFSKKTKASNGAWAMPDGSEFYKAEIQRHCSIALDPDELHEWGLVETKRLKSEIEDIGRKVGYRGSKMPFLRHLATSSEFYFDDTPKGRAQYMEHAKQYIAEISSQLHTITSQPPSVPLEVRPVDPVSAAISGRAYYLEPAADGSSPGIFFLNVERVADGPAYQLEAVCYHEAIPGHHLQAAAAIRLADVPIFRRQLYVGAFAEGWALYAEKFPKELGFYSDPYQDAGRASLELFRAARVVVDTGIHHKRWDLNRAIQFMNENTGNAPSDNVTEVKRYFNWPGQALSYKVGMQHIERLRNISEEALGHHFRISDFHAAVLSSGSITLPMLSKKIEKFTDG